MFCKNCGKQFEGKFCPVCGTKCDITDVPQPPICEATPTSETPTSPKPKKKPTRNGKSPKKRILVILFIIVGLLVLVGLSVFLVKNVFSKKFDPDNITEAAYDTYIEYDDALLAAEAAYLSEEGFVDHEDIPALLDDVEDIAKQGVSAGDIAYYTRDEETVFIKYSSGIPYMFIPYEKDILSIGSGGRILTLEPNQNDYSVRTYYGLSTIASWMANVEYRGDLSLPSNANLITDEFPDLYTYDHRYALPYDTVDPLLGAGDSLRNSNVTVESMRKLTDYKVIIWEGHGGYNSTTHSTLITGESFIGFEAFSKYKKEMADDVIILSSFPTIVGTEIPYSPVRHYCITSKFIQNLEGDLDGALVFLGACSSLEDDVLAQSFLDKGASVVLGYTEPVNMYYEMISRTVFFDQLTHNNHLTIADAYQKTMSIMGTDGSCRLSYVTKEEDDAYYSLDGVLGGSAVVITPEEAVELAKTGVFQRVDKMPFLNDTVTAQLRQALDEANTFTHIGEYYVEDYGSDAYIISINNGEAYMFVSMDGECVWVGIPWFDEFGNFGDNYRVYTQLNMLRPSVISYARIAIAIGSDLASVIKSEMAAAQPAS